MLPPQDKPDQLKPGQALSVTSVTSCTSRRTTPRRTRRRAAAQKIENADVRPHACQPPRGLNADAVPALRVPTPAGVEAEELGARDVSATRCAFHSLQAMAAVNASSGVPSSVLLPPQDRSLLLTPVHTCDDIHVT